VTRGEAPGTGANIEYTWRGELSNEELRICTKEAPEARCEWLHVDLEDSHRAFYFDRCGFEPTNAGLIKLV
jgi:hypothetical protein